MKVISVSIFLSFLSVWLFKLYTLATLPFIFYNCLLLSHPILLYWYTTMSLNYFLNIYDNPFMSKLKKITFSMHPCIPAGQMSRKRVYTIVVLEAVTTSTPKELCIVYLQRSKPKCIRIQQSTLPSSYISTNVILTNRFFLPPSFPHFSLSSSLSLPLLLHSFSLSPCFISGFWKFLKYMEMLQRHESTLYYE